MRGIWVGMALAAGLAVGASVCRAGEWTLVLDTPAYYQFAQGRFITHNHPASPVVTHNGLGPAGPSDSGSISQLSGSGGMLISPAGLGLGYEDFTIADKVQSACPQLCGGHAALRFRMTDAVIGFASTSRGGVKFQNIVGYGVGEADLTIHLPRAVSPTLTARRAGVEELILGRGRSYGRWGLLALARFYSVQRKHLATPGLTPVHESLLGDVVTLNLGVFFRF